MLNNISPNKIFTPSSEALPIKDLSLNNNVFPNLPPIAAARPPKMLIIRAATAILASKTARQIIVESMKYTPLCILLSSFDLISCFTIGTSILSSNLINSVTSKNNSAYIDHDQLVVYHFHQLDYFAPGQFDLARGYKFSHAIENYIYKPYLKTLDEVYAKVKKIDSDFRLIPPKRSISAKIKSKVSKYFGPLYWRLRGLIQ